MARKRIGFVCTANTCRSAMAELVARELSEETAEDRFEFVSGGVWAEAGSRASENAREALTLHVCIAQIGLDLSEHRSSVCDVAFLKACDVVFVMCEWHLNEVAQLMSALSEQDTPGTVSMLAETDIPDPIGRDLSTYQRTLDVLRLWIKRRLRQLTVTRANSTDDRVSAHLTVRSKIQQELTEF
ncbi:MAG: hypothetical protein MHM6MM_007144 [Cercozoa sp. M6MM]